MNRNISLGKGGSKRNAIGLLVAVGLLVVLIAQCSSEPISIEECNALISEAQTKIWIGWVPATADQTINEIIDLVQRAIDGECERFGGSLSDLPYDLDEFKRSVGR